MLPFTMAELADAVERGDVTRQKHPDYDLFIYNYSKDTQWRRHWTDITMTCRGLILDGQGNIVARPWKKFFNLGEIELPIQFDTPVEITDKADGSLGILYETDSGWAVATRGSFMSDQALHATALINSKYRECLQSTWGMEHPDVKKYTFLFEIVYPDNRIVLDYDGMDDLILLGAVEKETGYYVGPGAAAAMGLWSGPVTEVMEHQTLSDALGGMGRKNREGFVVRAGNFMCKVKEPEYIEVHRLVTNCTPKNVWEQLRAGTPLGTLIANFPDEFHDYVRSMAEPILKAFDRRSMEIADAYVQTRNSIPHDASRREVAEIFKKDPKNMGYFFALYDNRDITDALWKEVRPKNEVD